MSNDRRKSREEQSREENVGYGRPPKSTRWKKGQSGNPKGRSKGAKGLKSDLKAVLASRMSVKIGGKTHTGTKQELMLMTLSTRAAAGDTKAAAKLLDIIISVLGVEDEDARSERLSPQDSKLLDQMLGYTEAERLDLPRAEGSSSGGSHE